MGSESNFLVRRANQEGDNWGLKVAIEVYIRYFLAK